MASSTCKVISLPLDTLTGITNDTTDMKEKHNILCSANTLYI